MGESHTRANLSTNTGLFLQLYRRGKSHTADTPTNAGTNTSRVRLSPSELTTNTCATGPKSSRTDPTPRRNSPAYDSRNSLRETRVRATAVQPVDMPMVREQVRDFFTSFLVNSHIKQQNWTSDAIFFGHSTSHTSLPPIAPIILRLNSACYHGPAEGGSWEPTSPYYPDFPITSFNLKVWPS